MRLTLEIAHRFLLLTGNEPSILVCSFPQFPWNSQDDPAEDSRPAALVLALADLVGNVNSRDAAEGIQQALWEICARWTIGS